MSWVKLTGKLGFIFAALLLPAGMSVQAAVPEPSGTGLFPGDRNQPYGWSRLAGFDLSVSLGRAGFHAVHFQSRLIPPAGATGLEAAGHEFQQTGMALSGPSWSYQPEPRGPVLELAALGAGRKGRPKLVHVSIDWSF